MPGFRALLDCGATSLVALKRADVDPSTIDAVVVTHFHGDHAGGIPYLVLDGQFRRRDRPLTVAGPPGVADRVRTMFEAALPTSSATLQRFAISYVELTPAITALGPLGALALPVAHLAATTPHGVRLEIAGHAIAYTGDSEWCDALPPLADGADLLIAE